ncbi:MAG: hypothetical protein E4H14_04480 [Candidatus Thorarchaeota archaeon]|nr:MAG: hypothetical protein E4H14_04480 [Candidatus Thorarchaeota archaeon]
MTGEGREYGRRNREGSDEDEETDRIVREIIDEIRREQENEESPEPVEAPEQVYDAEQRVREAIEEIQQEEAERLRLEEQKESKEEPQESKEKVEISEEWDVDECVREVIEEVQQEEAERQRLREEREHAEMENEEQLEASYESRKETADKDELDEYEERIREGFDEYGIEPDEVKERWRKKFEEEVQEELGEKSGEQTEGEDDEATGSERTPEGHYYYDDGSGQVYEVQMDFKESSGSETESCNEVQEVQEETQSEQHETTESKKDSGESEPKNVTPTQETEDVVGEKARTEERFEQEESTKVETEEVKQVKEKTTTESVDESSEEHSECTPEIDAAPEKSEKKSSSTPETDTKRTDEHTESKGSHDTEENVEEESESREEEIWKEYDIEHGSLEDENHKRYLREVMDQLPKEEQEGFKEYVREKVQTIEDFEELARKHGLDELLEDEEVMEEIRNYLKVRCTLEEEPDTDIERLAEEIGIDAELAEEWSRGESEPYSLKKLLNLEAFYLWDEIIRNYREQNLPQSREELEQVLETNSELQTDRFFSLELDDAVAWVEIIAMRRRGEIHRRIRNGREVYSRKQIMELSKTYTIPAREIISWLRGERVPPLIEKIGKKNLKQKNRERTSFDTGGLIGTKRAFEQSLSRNQNIRLDKRFDNWYRDVMIFFEIEEKAANGEVDLEKFAKEHGISTRKLRELRMKRPYLLDRLERSELQRIYAAVHGSSPEVSIESMEDLKRLLDIHEDLRLDNYVNCEIYFEMRKLRAQGWTYTKLSKKFKMSRANINLWLNEYPPKPIPKLREAEEKRIIQSWAQDQALKLRIAADHEADLRRKLRRIVLPDNGKIDSLDALENAVRKLAMQLDLPSERVLFAEVDLDNSKGFLSAKKKLEQLARRELKLSNDSKVYLALVDGRLYIWVPNSQPFRLINLYSDLYFYFPNSEGFAKFLNHVKTSLDRGVNLSLERTHLENLISQMCDMEKSVSFRNEKGRRVFRVKSAHLLLLLDMLGMELSNLEGKISRITGNTGYGGIENPRFPSGERLAIVLARLYTTIGCDGHINKKGRTTYYEEELDRIALVEETLRELGDIQLKPWKSEKDNCYECYLPSIIGKMVIRMGLCVGDKTLQNPKLDRRFLNLMNFESSRAFVADTIPEDGTVKPGRISCTHSVRLSSNIGKDEIDLIKNHGKKEGSRWRLPVGKLRKLRNSKDTKTAQTAKSLYQRVMANPCNQIQDEKQIVESLGVGVVDSAVSVHYHRKSGNVTVSWRWTTSGEKNAMKLAIIAPPNDVKKREVLRKWLLENPEETEKMYRELRSQGLNVSRWWIDK